jgi:hypothetical protein
MLEREIFICDCHSLEHQCSIFQYEEEIYFEIHLSNYKNFFQRLLQGIKYIFGHKSRQGDWDTFILNPEDKLKLIKHLQDA